MNTPPSGRAGRHEKARAQARGSGHAPAETKSTRPWPCPRPAPAEPGSFFANKSAAGHGGGLVGPARAHRKSSLAEAWNPRRPRRAQEADRRTARDLQGGDLEAMLLAVFQGVMLQPGRVVRGRELARAWAMGRDGSSLVWGRRRPGFRCVL